jgi:hypothetical protein
MTLVQPSLTLIADTAAIATGAGGASIFLYFEIPGVPGFQESDFQESGARESGPSVSDGRIKTKRSWGGPAAPGRVTETRVQIQ